MAQIGNYKKAGCLGIMVTSEDNATAEVSTYARTYDGKLKAKLSKRFDDNRKFIFSKKCFAAYFSDAVGVSLEKFFNREQVKYVIELFTEKKQSIVQIATQMQYNHPSHVYNQFERVTGTKFKIFKEKIEMGMSFRLNDDFTIIFS